VYHPDVVSKLHGINEPKRIAPVRQSDLEYSGTQTFHRLGDVSLGAFGGNRQSR
jgi:hypothetical protein